MNPRPAFGNETRDRGFLVLSLEQLDQRLAGAEPDDARPVRIVERRFPQTENIAEEWKGVRECLYGDSDV